MIFLVMFLLSVPVLAQNPVLSCEDFDFDRGCKIDRGLNAVYECDGAQIDVEWYSDFELMRFESTVPIEFVGAKAALCYRMHYFDPPTLQAEDLIACEGRKHSHDLFCWSEDPPPSPTPTPTPTPTPEPETGCCILQNGSEPDLTETECGDLGGEWLEGESCPEIVDTMLPVQIVLLASFLLIGSWIILMVRK